VSVQGVTVCTAGGQLASNRVTAQVSLGRSSDRRRRPVAHPAVGPGPGSYSRPPAIHLLPIAWSVDGQRGMRDPRAMFGRSLGLELLVVSMQENIFRTLGHCVERAHLSVRGRGRRAVRLGPGGPGRRRDGPRRRLHRHGRRLDLGGGVQQRCAAPHRQPAVGGGHVTQDIARGLSTSVAGAERIKTLHGSAIASRQRGPRDDRGSAARRRSGRRSGDRARAACSRASSQPRVEETLELLRERLKASGAPVEPGAGVVLTGGASQLAGVREVAVRVFDRPVRLGRPRRVPHLADAASGPAFCAAAGTLHRTAFGPREAVSSKALAGGPVRKRPLDPNASPMAKAAAWLRDNL
jgi:cell division protein FtsA